MHCCTMRRIKKWDLIIIIIITVTEKMRGGKNEKVGAGEWEKEGVHI